MKRKRGEKMKNLSNVIWGFAFIIVGTILALNSFGITDINVFFKGWWTLFIIVPCFIGLFNNNEDKTGNIIGLIIGVLLLLSSQEIITYALVWKLFFPIILIGIGLSFIFKNTIGNSINNKIKEINSRNNKNDKDNKEYISTFSGQKIDFTKEEFKGCSMSAIFGGVELDLTDAIIKEDVVITATSIFGGIDIRTSKDVNVKVSSTSVFGGVENNTKNKDGNKITIYINATCLFGGVEIK